MVRSRDLDVLAWAGEMYGVRVDQLECLLGCGPRNVQRVVTRLRAHGLVRVLRLVYGQAAWVTPTPLGNRVSGLGFGVWKPNLALLRHVGAVNDVRLHIQSRSPSSTWISERVLARDRRPGEHLPDAVVVVDGQEIAVEVELTVKSQQRIKTILDELARRYGGVLYFCAPAAHKRLEQLVSAGRWPGLGIRELPTNAGEGS